MQNKFDLIFGIGTNCNTSLMLRQSNLQTASFPFDWLDNSVYENNLSILAQKFNNFIDKDDLVLIPNADNKVSERYLNKKTGLNFVHDFPIGKDFDIQYPLTKEKYERRIGRLIKRISESNKVLIVYMTTNNNDKEKITEQTRSFNLNKTFPNTEIHYLYIINTNNSKKYIYQDKTINLTIVCDDFSIKQKEIKLLGIKISYKTTKLKKLLSKYKLNMSAKEKFNSLKYKTNKFLINLIPNKTLQMNLRHSNKYN